MAASSISSASDLCSARRRAPFGSAAAAWGLFLGLLACGDAGAPGPEGPSNNGGGPSQPSPRTPSGPAAPAPIVDGTAHPLPADTARGAVGAETEFSTLQADVERLRNLDADEVLAEFPLSQRAELGYAPGSAAFLDRVQASALALNDNELARLGQNGFVISKRQQFPTFLRGYAAIYMEHLPVYVSADAMLDAVHRSYDAMLEAIERSLLAPELAELLRVMQSGIATANASPETQADLRLYLEVAAALLAEQNPPGLSPAGAALVAKARAATGIETVPLFGIDRLMDFSQFTPRGHYTEGLENYFRAMMWLGRVDFRLIETQSDGSLVFRRGQYEAVLALQQLMSERATQLWSHIDGAVQSFVGESDSMTVPEIAKLVEDLGGIEAARAATDTAVTAAIRDGGYGEQQIASHLMVNDGIVKTLPLNRSFLVFGQRYIADSHVFSEVVYDRIAGRMLPNPLDAAFAALGNNQALRLIPDLGSVEELPGALGGMRHLIDAHPQSFWDANLYNLWSSALRTLSPASDASAASEAGLPSVAGTEAWGRRLLNTQLGSWAQLRHDTLLYAKQSYSGIPGCEFPDAYIEPYPAFFAALVRYADRGDEIARIAAANEYLGPAISQYFARLRSTSALLGQMAEQQRAGTPHSAEQLAFINDAIRVEQQPQGCTLVEVPEGWYADLFFQRERSIEQDLTIADVHTQPADELGNIVGKVLHVGTSYPRLMAVTVDTCVGPRAYVGMSYAYLEQVTDDFERLTDEAWTERIESGNEPADVPWVADLVAE
jgi:uncharacterized protein DUF3160